MEEGKGRMGEKMEVGGVGGLEGEKVRVRAWGREYGGVRLGVGEGEERAGGEG